MSKVVYIIPGFGEDVSLRGYQQTIKFFKSKNFKVVPIKITWKYKVMSDYVDELFCQLSHKKSDEIYMFGFSFGAMIAFISAVKIKPKMLFLCSLSPFFKEDLKSQKKSWIQGVGKKRIRDLKNFSFLKIAEDVKCKTILFVGEEESPEVYSRANDAHKKIKNSELVIANGARHEISQKEYVDTLHEAISKL